MLFLFKQLSKTFLIKKETIFNMFSLSLIISSSKYIHPVSCTLFLKGQVMSNVS